MEPIYLVKLTKDEIETLLMAIENDRNELCTGPGFVEANAYAAKLDTLTLMLSATIQQQIP